MRHEQLAPHVQVVLDRAARGKGKTPRFLTAYQILERVPASVRGALVQHYAKPGKGAGRYYSAASRLGRVAEKLGALMAYIDTRGISFRHDRRPVRAGYGVVRIYRAN